MALLPRGHLVTSGDSFGQHDCGWQDTTGQWAEARDTQHSTLNRTARRPRVIWPKMSTVLRLRNPGLDKKCKGPLGFPGGASGKEPACQCSRYKRHRFNFWIGKIPRRRARLTHCSLLAWRIPWTEESGQLQTMGLRTNTTEAT